MMVGGTRERGFTLIEVMVAMMIALIGSLALGTLFIGSMNSDSLAREREGATNLAKRIMEDWVASPTDALPTPNCSPAAAWASTGNPAKPREKTLTCAPTGGLTSVSYTVTVNTRDVKAPVSTPAGAVSSFRLGPGLRVTAILVDQNNSNHIWAGTDGAGLFESTDGGANWVRAPGLGYLNVNAIAQQPGSNPAVVYLATDSGLWNNQGIGGIWQPVTSAGLTATRYTAIAFDPSNANTIYVGAYGGVFASVNGGAWAKVNGAPPNNLSNMAVNDLIAATDPATGSTVLYAATNGGVYKGAVAAGPPATGSWSPPPASFTTNVHSLLRGAAPNTVYAGTVSNVRYSIDGGITWTAYFTTASDVRALALHAGAPVMATLKGVYDNGVGPKTAGILDAGGLRTYALAIDPNNASTWYAGTDEGIFKSTDAGANWTAAGGNPAPAANSLIENGFGIFPKEKVVAVSWQHKGVTHTVTLTHVSRRAYGPRPTG